MRERPQVGPGLVFGAFILAAGIILFLDRQGIINAGDYFRFWPLAVIGLGMARLLQPGGSGRVGGGILMFVGVMLQLRSLDILQFGFRELWPLGLIAVGVLLVWRSIETQREGVSAMPAAFLNRYAVLGGGEFKSDAKDFKGGEVLAIFGGYSIDLRGASMTGPSATIHANALFGGIELKVPETWSVSIQGLPILGGYTDSTRHPRIDDERNAKNLIVTGFAMFGGVEVKN